MIKCNVTVCGTVCRQAQMRANKEGKQFISFGISVVVQAKTGINKTVEISVAKDGDNQAELVNYPVGPVSRWQEFFNSIRKAMRFTSISRLRE